ncbi:5-oxoprolinase subunit PxpA [Portibacter marinus]|uniref:5-oxoprolinase subunit PxpA n=1 Tax=Portibacter marinus TaxID=2898660 RepID=UPI001F32EB0B|nr:5-oxoprolinase subunit PxpA [Portibacter marinus]
MKSIDLNCDMGEQPYMDVGNFDHLIMPYISSCNISCGFHSGSPKIIEATIESALKNKVNIGAHPSYNDRKNYGRISLSISWSDLQSELKYQIFALKGMVESKGGRLNHIKPHGALYNDMVKDALLASHVVDLVKGIAPECIIIGLAESHVKTICIQKGMRFWSEGFADRAYEHKTQLRNRQLEGAVIEKEEKILEQVESFVNGQIETYNGIKEKIEIDTICLHSDTLGAVELSRSIVEYLYHKGIKIGLN